MVTSYPSLLILNLEKKQTKKNNAMRFKRIWIIQGIDPADAKIMEG